MKTLKILAVIPLIFSMLVHSQSTVYNGQASSASSTTISGPICGNGTTTAVCSQAQISAILGTTIYDSYGTATTLVSAETSRAEAAETTDAAAAAARAGVGNCTSGLYETGDATGGPACAQVAYSQLGGTVPTWNQSTTGNAATATNPAATPAQCSSGYFATGVSASAWAASCAQVAYSNLTGVPTAGVGISLSSGQIANTGAVTVNGQSGTTTTTLANIGAGPNTFANLDGCAATASSGVLGVGMGQVATDLNNTFFSCQSTPNNGYQMLPINGESVLANFVVPVYLCPNGTITTAGQVTFVTALPTYGGTIVTKFWCWFPSTAFSSSPAQLYYVVASSATVGYVYTNGSVNAATTPFVPYIPTGSLTTVTGSNSAYTQTTGTYEVLVNILIPAHALGVYGGLALHYQEGYSNSTNNKLLAFGILGSWNQPSTFNTSGAVSAANLLAFQNYGSESVQVSLPNGNGSNLGLPAFLGGANTASAQNFILEAQIATATDYGGFIGGIIRYFRYQ